MVSFARELESSPSPTVTAFSGASAADHLVTAKHSLTSNMDQNPNFVAEKQAAKTTLEMAKDGLELRQAELAQVADEAEEPNIARRAGAEVGAAVASTPVELAMAASLDALVPGAGTATMMMFKATQAASVASIAGQALSAPQATKQQSGSYFDNDNGGDSDDAMYSCYADEGTIMSSPTQVADLSPPESSGPGLYWKDMITSDPVTEALARQHEYASSMLGDIAVLQDRELELPRPTFGLAA